QFGYHIIKVNGKKEAKTLEFAEVKADLTETLFDQAKSEKMDTFVTGLREKAQIKQPGAPDAPKEGPAAPSKPAAL
ncbi:MAG: peptidylprolyl isomerase, partial [Verrucomicrobiae bacterium]|nr:peptidylprolyl isomerase [Verrucomicrobiae bacterium]